MSQLNKDIIENKSNFFNALQKVINSIFATILNESDRETISKINEYRLNQEINDFLLNFDAFKFSFSLDENSHIYNDCNIMLLNTSKKFNKSQKLMEKETLVLFDKSLLAVSILY